MFSDESIVDPQAFATFGALLRYLRRRARLTQRDLGIAVGYSEGHINRFEKNKHLPDPSAVAALFVPALDLGHESALAARLIDLTTSAPSPSLDIAGNSTPHSDTAMMLEPIPPRVSHAIARTRVLARVHDRLAQTRRIALCGLPGVGKTTLAGDVAREYTQTMPVFWLTLTTGVTASVDALLRQIALFLIAHGQDQVKPIDATDPHVKTVLKLDQQIALLGAAFAKQPALLCFDNAELIRCDEACLQVLQHLSAATTAFLLLTTRERLPLANIAEITLDGFECDEGLTFIAQSSDQTLDEEQAERLVEKTAGNPMLIQLALGQLLDHHAEAETFIAHLGTQPQVADYLLQTIQKQLSASAGRLLLLLPVFQQPINLYDPYLAELTHTLGGIENIGEAIVELQRRRLIDNAASAHLHPLVRDYAYLTLNVAGTLRQHLHRLAADWFRDANRDAFAAAFHSSHAGLPRQALDLIEENERAITERGQALSAVAILDEVQTQIKRLRTEPTELLRRLLTMRGILLTGTLRLAEGETNLREAVALASNPAVRAHIIYKLAELTNQRSDFQETLRLTQAARAELAPSDLLLRARLVSLESIAYGSLGNCEETGRAANEALALADQLAGLPPALVGEIRARAQIELADNARQQRDLTTAMNHAQAALAAARVAHQPRAIALALMYVGGLSYDMGNLAASFRDRSEGLEGLLAIDDVHSAAYALTYLADIHYLRLEPDQALEKLGRAIETLRIVDDMRGLAAAESARMSCLLWCGQIQAARVVIERLLKEAEGKGTERLWGYRLKRLVMVQLVQQEMEAALVTLRHALDLPSASAQSNRMLHFELHSLLAFALIAAGDNAAGAKALADTPYLDGLSRWAEFDRNLIEGYAALAGGNPSAAYTSANQVKQRTENYPLYRQSAIQLIDAIQQTTPVHLFPQWMWVGRS